MARRALPNLAQLNARLESGVNRTLELLERLPERCDELLSLAISEKWQRVAELSDDLAQEATEVGLSGLAQAADETQTAIRQGATEIEIRRRVIHVVSACGTTRVAPAKSQPKRTSRRRKSAAIATTRRSR